MPISSLFRNVFTITGASPKPVQRAFLFIFAYLCLSGVCVLGFAQFVSKQWFWFAWGISASAAAIGLWRWVLKQEGKHFPDPWITPGKNTLLRFFAGFGIGGTILFSIVLLLIYLLPLELVIVKDSHILQILGWSIALLFCAFHEEMGFRSYFLKNLQTAKGIWKSQFIIAIVFAVYHILGGQDVLNSILSTSLWSVVFGLAAVYSRGLAFPTGIHAASTIGQAFLGMKIKEGFGALFVLRPIHMMPANVTPVILASQAFVLFCAIVIFGFLVRKNRFTVENSNYGFERL
jgi:membrane protease YdiL (CAAX protease family)